MRAVVLTNSQIFPETKGRTLEEIAIVFDGKVAEPEVHRRMTVETGLKGHATDVTEEHKEYARSPRHLA